MLKRKCFKLNTDGSWMNLDNAGGGGVIRCAKGLWQEGFSINFNAMSAASSELLAIREGLLTARKRRIQFLDLETDADALTKMLKNPYSFKDHDQGNIIKNVASILDRYWNVTIFHAKRTVNLVDDRLATIGRTKVKKGEKEI
uniref:RNase H type-1 domain-containing protein n=1 Tax=Chenopodium quinoa TaxID=63459 RepID=A0A803N8C2_CHEQI